MITEGRIQTTDLAGAEGAQGPVRLGKTFSQAIMDAHARYYDAVRRGNVFMAVNTALGALTVNATSATGLILWNPPQSGKSLVLMRLMVAMGSLPAAASTLILTGGPLAVLPATAWTPLAGTGNYNGVLPAHMGQQLANKSIAYAASVANSIVSTTIQRYIPCGPAATLGASTVFPPFISDEIAGEIILGPGQVISLQALTTAITVGASLTWEEVPVS